MPRPSSRGFPGGAWLALCCALVNAFATAAPPAGEYQVKAAYLFNFGQFVEWPSQSWESPGAPLVIGIVGNDPFGRLLDDVVRGESIEGHPLEVRRFASPQDVTPCHILFIGRSEAARLGQDLQALRGRSVLTVTDIEDADKQGAIITLLNDNNRVRMRINLAAAKASRLVISSKLLRPAEVVGNDAG